MAKKNFTVYIDEKAITAAKRKAKKNTRSINQFVEMLFTQKVPRPKL